MKLTSIKLPLKKSITKDKEGYDRENIFWSESYPAGVRDTTDKEAVVSHQFGYDAETVFEIESVLYNRQKFLQNDADGAIYDIKRAVKKNSSFKVLLYTTQRIDGDGIQAVM